MRSCDSCDYFDVTHYLADNPEISVAGCCRRYAPVPPGNAQWLDQEEPDSPRVAVWPIVAAGDWCGEFAKKAADG